KLVEWAGRYLPGAVFTDGFFQNSTRESTRTFVEAYRARFGKDPERLSALGYDNALILKTLFEQTPPCSTADLRDALLDLRDFDGATGPTSFGPDGDARKELFLLTIRGGAIVEVAKPPMTS
ncbi:ABC transporter substrate-binding protein, partial [Myxococcota bacterium]